MNRKKRIFVVVCAASLLVCLGGCRDVPWMGESSAPASSAAPLEQPEQLQLPNADDTIAVLHTSLGDIVIRLFPEVAPKAVDNFQRLIRSGYYNNLLFHRVEADTRIQSGDPTGTGLDGESAFGTPFADEFSDQLLNLRGAVAMASDAPDSNGSQFFINTRLPALCADVRKETEQAYADHLANAEEARGYYQTVYDRHQAELAAQYPTFDAFFAAQYGQITDPEKVPEKVWKYYETYGGNLAFDGAFRQIGGSTVFGQVISGMEIVDAIAALKTDEAQKPLTDVTITSAELPTYAAWKAAQA